MWSTSRLHPWTDPLPTLHCCTCRHFTRFHDIQFHFYADDTQLYISFSINDDLELTSSIVRIENCISNLDKWMALNKLKLNKDKTELLYLYSKHNPQQSLPPLRFGSDIIQPSSSSKNIGVVFKSTMSMLPHVKSVSKSAFYKSEPSQPRRKIHHSKNL